MRQHLRAAHRRARSAGLDAILALTAYGTYPVPDAAVDEKTLDARVDAIVAAQKTAGSSVSRWRGGLKPGAYGAPLRGFGA